MNNLIRNLSLVGLLPVLKIDREEDAAPVAKALSDGGIPCVEVTFRTPAAKNAINRIARDYPNMLVGAGTVLTADQVDQAVSAGAAFIVSPGLNPDVVRYCQKIGTPVIPGINNPSGIEQAMSLGLDTVKFFPAQQSGGIDMIKAMSAPYPQMTFMPTGGVNLENMNDYLSCKKVVAVGGSWIVSEKLIQNGDFDSITRLSREAIDHMLGFSLSHVGVNCRNTAEAKTCADTFLDAFSFPTRELPVSYFAGPGLEFMKEGGRGTMGHIAIATNNVDRAVYHLKRRGIAFDDASAKYAPDGSLTFIYLRDEIGGFAYHLTLK